MRILIAHRAALGLIASFVLGCHPAAKTAATISVWVPLSGALSEQGNAVLKVSTLINTKLAGTGAPTFRVIDSNISSDRLQAQLAAENNRFVVLGGCAEAQAMNAAYPTAQGPTAVVLFCDTRDVVAHAVDARPGALRYFWIGPLQADFSRGFKALLASADTDFQSVAYNGYTLLYSIEQQAEIEDVIGVFNEIGWDGLSVNFLPVHESDATHIVDYSNELQQIRALAANFKGHNVYSALPWLSTQAFLMQARVILGDDFASLRSSWYGLFDYQVDDAVGQASPFDLTNIRSLSVLGNADAASLVDFRVDISAAFHVSGDSMLSRIATDALAMTALAEARLGARDTFDFQAQDKAFLDVTGANGGTPVTYSTLAKGIAAARGAVVNYAGVFDTFDHFDKWGLANRDKSVTASGVLPNGAFAQIGSASLEDSPLQGVTVNLPRAVTNGCLSGEPPPGTVQWAPSAFDNMFDFQLNSGLVSEVNNLVPAGVNFHFLAPVQMTDVTILHSRTLNSPVPTQVRHHIAWWSTALPVGFDYQHPPIPPDGEVDLPQQTIGLWASQDWSFAPQTIQTMTIVANYLLPSQDPLFDDVHFFLTDASAATFCP